MKSSLQGSAEMVLLSEAGGLILRQPGNTKAREPQVQGAGREGGGEGETEPRTTGR